MLPRITVEGRLVADPELKFSQSGTAICSMRVVAADRKRTDSGEWVDGDTLWLDVVCFKQLAEHTVESLVKGDGAIFHGKIRTEEWEDRNGGGKRSKISMVADLIGPSLQFRTLPHGTGQEQRVKAPAQQAYAADPGSAYQGDLPPF